MMASKREVQRLWATLDDVVAYCKPLLTRYRLCYEEASLPADENEEWIALGAAVHRAQQVLIPDPAADGRLALQEDIAKGRTQASENKEGE